METLLPSRKRQRAASSGSEEEEEDDEGAGASQPLCEVCGREPRKYCCPRCGTLTCSLACCTAHKKVKACDGKRDVSAFAKTKDMGLRELRQDCAFLESVERSKETATREWSRGGAATLGARAKRRGGAGAGARLQRAAEKRRVRLLLMPEGMGKRARNGSYHDRARDAMRWRVEWSLEVAGAAPVLFVDAHADERAPLRDLLAAHLAKIDGAARARLAPTGALDDPAALAVLLLRVPGPSNDPKYDRLDVAQGLHLNLVDKCVIEYPQLTVVPASDVGARFALAPSAVQLLFDDEADDPDEPMDAPTPQPSPSAEVAYFPDE